MNYSCVPYVLLNITCAIICSYGAKLAQDKFLKVSNKYLCVVNILLAGMNIYRMIAA